MSDGRPPVLQAYERDEPRRGQDRRAKQRRAPHRPLDPLFAATLVNQLAAPETVYVQGYAEKPRLRAGIAFDLEA